jgi:hypothetical protein
VLNPSESGTTFNSIFATFTLGVITLGIKYWVDRFSDNQTKRVELTSLMDLYITEIVRAIERCSQHVRKAVMGRTSASKLSLLVGPGKIDHAAALGATPDCLKCLHDAYRLFDVVQAQLDTRRPEDFPAIYTLVLGEINTINVAVPRLIEYTRELHGKKERIGKRLLGQVFNAMLRARKDFLLGVPDKKPLGLSRHDIYDLQKCFDKAMKEISEWGAANSTWAGLFRCPPGDMAVWVESAVGMWPSIRAKVLRCLSVFVKKRAETMIAGGQFAMLPDGKWEALLRAGWELAGIPAPDPFPLSSNQGVTLSFWSNYLTEHDPLGWDM